MPLLACREVIQPLEFRLASGGNSGIYLGLNPLVGGRDETEYGLSGEPDCSPGEIASFPEIQGGHHDRFTLHCRWRRTPANIGRLTNDRRRHFRLEHCRRAAAARA